MNKISSTSKLGEDVQVDWSIEALPSSMLMLTNRDGKTNLTNNMKETIDVEKHKLFLAKKSPIEEKKTSSQPTKKVTFKEENKNQNTKHVFDIEYIQNFIKTHSNVVVDLKK